MKNKDNTIVYFRFITVIVNAENGIYERGEESLTDKHSIPADLAGIYKEIAEVIGVEATILLHDHFLGQQITLPKKLFTKEYVIQQAKQTESNTDIKVVALQYGYTERHLRQIIKEQKHIKIT